MDIHFSLPLSLLKNVINFFKSPKEFSSKAFNIIRSMYSDKYKKIPNKNKYRNYAVNERTTSIVILKDGTLILHISFEIFMLEDGDFEIERYFSTENPNKVDLSKIKEIYEDGFSNKIEEDRFRDYLLVVNNNTTFSEKQGIVFKAKIIEKNKNKIKYQIKYDNLKRFDTIRFEISLTVPKEYDRDYIKDKIIIEPIYGVYKLEVKIDRQHPYYKNFSPKLENIKYSRRSDCSNMWYRGFYWKFYLPKKGKIRLFS